MGKVIRAAARVVARAAFAGGEFAAEVRGECARLREAQLAAAREADGHDDAAADAVALTCALRCGDTAGIAVILKHANAYSVSLNLARLLAAAADEVDASPEWFRRWAGNAKDR